MIQGINRNPASTPQEKPSTQQKRLKEACQEFESVMTNYLLKSMRQSIDRAEKPEQGREVFEGFFDESISKELAKQQGSGLSDTLYKQLSPLVRENKKR